MNERENSIKRKVDQVKQLLTPGIEFAGISRLECFAKIDEMAALDKELRDLNNPAFEGHYIYPEYIQARRDDYILWGDLPLCDWEYLLEGIEELKRNIEDAKKPRRYLAPERGRGRVGDTENGR